MFGKHFGSMYEGSMVGAGATVFAVMGYVIAKQVPDRVIGSQVRLNPLLLGTILGESPKDIEKAIGYLCAPDPKSTTKNEGGRRLIRVGEFDYQVVNGAKYRAIKDAESKRDSDREAKRRQRAKSSKTTMTQAEIVIEKAENSGDEAAAKRARELNDGVAPGTYGAD